VDFWGATIAVWSCTCAVQLQTAGANVIYINVYIYMNTYIYVYALLKIHYSTPCSKNHPQAWLTLFLKKLTEKWSWYRCSCDYHSSVLEFLELYLHKDLKHNVKSLLLNPLFRKLEDWQVASTAATVPRPFCCQNFKKRGVPRRPRMEKSHCGRTRV